MTTNPFPNRPLVSVVIATCGRPELLRLAIRSILKQDYPGPVEAVVVFDKMDIDPLKDIETGPRRSLRLLKNTHTPGLAGGRNTGILAATGDFVGFCDDDDEWDNQKLSKQMFLWRNRPHAVAIASGIRIQTEDGRYERIPPEQASFHDFLRSRITGIHPSTMLFRREDLLGRIGLVDEDLPASYGEDYELLLRATRYGPVVSVLEPMVLVRWNRPSFFAGRWENIAAGLTYILQKFPEFDDCPSGTARIAGQVAFAHAAMGNDQSSHAWARSALTRNPGQLRAYAALLVSAGVVKPSTLLNMVQRYGRGI